MAGSIQRAGVPDAGNAIRTHFNAGAFYLYTINCGAGGTGNSHLIGATYLTPGNAGVTRCRQAHIAAGGHCTTFHRSITITGSNRDIAPLCCDARVIGNCYGITAHLYLTTGSKAHAIHSGGSGFTDCDIRGTHDTGVIHGGCICAGNLYNSIGIQRAAGGICLGTRYGNILTRQGNICSGSLLCCGDAHIAGRGYRSINRGITCCSGNAHTAAG